jgi:hypothetical protein
MGLGIKPAFSNKVSTPTKPFVFVFFLFCFFKAHRTDRHGILLGLSFTWQAQGAKKSNRAKALPIRRGKDF